MRALHEAAAEAGLTVSADARWPETDADIEVPALAGFVESSFSPLIAEVAGRALRRHRPQPNTAIVIVTPQGDVTSASHVAAVVDRGERVMPLLFFQSVPNAVAGYLAARWHLTGPVVCVTGTATGLGIAALLIEDSDADEALVVRVTLAADNGGNDRAAAILVTGPQAGSDPLTP